MIDQITWLAVCIYHEARGEPDEGKRAVAHVILNRVDKRGKSIKDVVTEPYQFSWYNKRYKPEIRDYNALARCFQAAVDTITERAHGKTLNDADHYHADYVDPRWSKKMQLVTKIGNHIFYRS